jgi:uncharacterized coiled-coil DUF342 family protein
MDAEALLQLTPELLAKALIHRHERLIEELPEAIKQHQDDLDFAKPQAESARSQRDILNTQVASLKSERNTCTSRAGELRIEAAAQREKLLEEGKLRNPDPKWAREKLDADLKQLEFDLETQAGDHKREYKILRQMRDLQAEHEMWVEKNAAKVPELKEYFNVQQEMRKLYDQAQKAHQTMLELVDENLELHNTFVEKEEKRRIAASRYSHSTRSLDISKAAIDGWNNRLSKGFDDLLTDQNRVAEGGMSSIAIRRNKKRDEEAAKSASAASAKVKGKAGKSNRPRKSKKEENPSKPLKNDQADNASTSADVDPMGEEE